MPESHEGTAPRPLLGILGGTFDPIHLGHLRLAEEVREALSLDRVHFVPAAVPPHRPQPALSAEVRLELVRAAVAENPQFVLDDRELRRQGASYTIDTLQDFHATHPDHHRVLILGMDAFNGLKQWHRWSELLEWAHIAVATRPGAPLADAAAQLLDDHALPLEQFRRQRGGGIIRIEITRLDISATAIRAALDAGRSVRYLVPECLLNPLNRHYSAPKKSQYKKPR
ncbi:nicotinate-nucleotide adenylyltransferase [Halothiobacillus diazotrophicus]|uniref:nicotinate-nucleotide adenylyltransferase n=1 Tax=Halothiobacillus diazotrophicus TaxID=1860122 RepID=UPI001E2A59B3|nr:nicotinate-nucleotide adenylyltransferase [Halothiobacillus diazotrophicus]